MQLIQLQRESTTRPSHLQLNQTATWFNYNAKSFTTIFDHNLSNYNVNQLQHQVIYHWLFDHAPLKRDQGNWEGRLRLNDIPKVNQLQRQVIYNLITYNVKSTTLIKQHQLQLGHLQRQSTTMSTININYNLITYKVNQLLCKSTTTPRGGGLGSRPKKMYGKRLGDGVEYHLMSPTPRR